MTAYGGLLSLTVATAVTFAGNFLAVGTANNCIHMWSIESGRRAVVLQGDDQKLGVLVASSDGKQIASGLEDGTVYLWNVHALTGEWLCCC
jgi:WD40 repeat protein